MILGKPGAGKTTFLKHLAMQCIGGKFQSDRVPIFITLKDFAEADDKPNLLAYIERLIAMPTVGAKHLENISLSNAESDRPNASPLHNILRAGKTLILLDGLDEVREADNSRVLRQIKEFSEHFSKNQFVVTCRIAAREYIFEQFTEVEISDFANEQIFNFVNKWFSNRNNLAGAEKILQTLQRTYPSKI
jgi:predicted NACHT family NTPase